MQLKVTNADGERVVSVTGSKLQIGREDGDLLIADISVSGRHAKITFVVDKWFIEDLGSTNGTKVNNKTIQDLKILVPGDIITLGNTVIEVLPYTKHKSQDAGTKIVFPISALSDGIERTIGRGKSADYCSSETVVSRNHATIRMVESVPSITDNDSRNGTFVNGIPIKTTVLAPGDLIKIGSTEFQWTSKGLATWRKKGPLQLDVRSVVHNVKAQGKQFSLLNNVDFTLKAGEFVAIVGGSGTGKTSLFRVLTGLIKPTNGSVKLNGVNYHKYSRLFSGQVGFVPQDDIVHFGLTVSNALMYAARLRLPRDTSEEEYNKCVSSVIESVGLLHRASTEIRTLSGGERKRVNVALELLTEPDLLYLDEPTSGLDPNREHQIMQLLRDLSNQGKTILVTTHSTLNLDMCDLLIVMGPGGRIVYFGPPSEALNHFGCSEFKDIYRMVGETQEESSLARRRFQDSTLFEEYGGTRNLPQVSQDLPSADQQAQRIDIASWLHQFPLLARRYLDVILNDRINLLILLVQAPVIVFAILIMFPSDTFKAVIDENGGSPLRSASGAAFLMTIAAIWFGTSNSAREIVKEFPIYVRERMAFLIPSAYFLSKFLILSLLCLIQCFILLVGVGLWMEWFDIGTAEVIKMGGLLLLASFAGLSIGLALSSMVRSSDQAVSMIPVILLPQIVFSGLFMPDNAGKLVEWLSKIHISYWAYGAIGKVLQINEKIESLTRPVVPLNSCFEGDLGTKINSLTTLLVLMVVGAIIIVYKRRTR